jgi:hypothetical protein
MIVLPCCTRGADPESVSYPVAAGAGQRCARLRVSGEVRTLLREAGPSKDHKCGVVHKSCFGTTPPLLHFP